jgi:hypothetical protein
MLWKLYWKISALEHILAIFEENIRIFQETTQVNFKKFQTWVRNFILNRAKHVHAKFQLSSLYHYIHFWRKFQDFSGKLLSEFQKFQIWVCNIILNLEKHVHAKFQLSSLYSDGIRHIFDHFWRKFLDFLGKLFSRF